jgi:hypothetical protein
MRAWKIFLVLLVFSIWILIVAIVGYVAYLLLSSIDLQDRTTSTIIRVGGYILIIGAIVGLLYLGYRLVKSFGQAKPPLPDGFTSDEPNEYRRQLPPGRR